MNCKMSIFFLLAIFNSCKIQPATQSFCLEFSDLTFFNFSFFKHFSVSDLNGLCTFFGFFLGGFSVVGSFLGGFSVVGFFVGGFSVDGRFFSSELSPEPLSFSVVLSLPAASPEPLSLSVTLSPPTTSPVSLSFPVFLSSPAALLVPLSPGLPSPGMVPPEPFDAEPLLRLGSAPVSYKYILI